MPTLSSIQLCVLVHHRMLFDHNRTAI